MSYLYILQHGCLNIIQRFIQNLRPSRLSTRSFQSKIYALSSQYRVKMKKKNDPLVSIQGHFNPKFTTLSSQYKVTSIQNLRPSRLSTRSKWKKMTLLSQYKSLQSKIYDPLVSVQGQNEKKKRPSCLSTSHFNLKFTTLSS